MKKILAVILSIIVGIGMLSCAVTAATTGDEKVASSVSKNENATASMIGAVLRAMLGDAASNLTDQDIGKIAQNLLGDIKLSDLPTLVLGSDGKKIVEEIQNYLNNLNSQTTTEVQSATRPAETTTQQVETQPSTTVPPSTAPATTAQPVTQYIYVYPQTTGAPAAEYTLPVGEYTTANFEITTGDYVIPDIIITNPDYNYYNGIADSDDSDSKDDGFGMKAVIGLLIMLGGGAAVVILLVRRKNNSVYY